MNFYIILRKIGKRALCYVSTNTITVKRIELIYTIFVDLLSVKQLYK